MSLMIVNQISLFSSTPIEITKVSKQTYWEKENELATLKADVREHISSRDYTSALSTAQNALDLSIKHFKLNHPVTGSCHSDLALVNKELGNYDLSRELYSKAGEIYESTVGKEHPSYATMINNLGQSFKGECAKLHVVPPPPPPPPTNLPYRGPRSNKPFLKAGEGQEGIP